MKKRIHLAFFLIILGIFFSFSVFAIGGGGGGSVTTCTSDTWNCTEWSECSSEGQETRVCTMTFDCEIATTPRPAESQSCTPPASTPTSIPPPTPTPTPEPTPQPTPTTISTPTPLFQKPQVKNTPKPKDNACVQDVWQCGEWQNICDKDGNQKRTCQLIKDCPNANTPPPAFVKRCEKLQCAEKTNLKERIACRLNLTPAGLTREYEIEYLPEECRALPSGKSREDCVKLYKAYKPCWDVPGGDRRTDCARNVLNLGRVISQEVKQCQGKTGQEQVQCKSQVKERVFSLIKFRFYDLEERAEELIEKGVDKNDVIEFSAIIQTKKQEFTNATTKEQRKQIILDVRNAWKAFLEKARGQIK